MDLANNGTHHHQLPRVITRLGRVSDGGAANVSGVSRFAPDRGWARCQANRLPSMYYGYQYSVLIDCIPGNAVLLVNLKFIGIILAKSHPRAARQADRVEPGRG